MPLDVLSKIQSFANGGSVDAGTKGAINQMIGDAQQNPALQSGLNGIANAVTNNGADINPDTMAKLARAGQAFSKAMEQANLAMLGIHGSFNSIDVTPLEKAEASLTGIAEHGKGISINIGTKGAESSLSSIANRIEKIRSSASIGVSVSTLIPRVQQQPKPQKFATGGRITYHRQNTETAQTGGIFRHGSSTGDRNMIFANRGEGIITEKAVRQGARQRGMSPESYVQALNHPSTNLARVKKGRSFSYGGLMTTGGYLNTTPEFNYLISYLTSDKFHGSERYGTPARRLQEIIDDYVITMAPTATDFAGLDANGIKRILTFAEHQETMYENDITERLSRIKDNSFNRARVVGTGTASRSIKNVVNDTNTGIASGTIPTSGPMHTTASSRQSLKTSARTTASRIKEKYENMSPEKQTSASGQMQKLVVDASSKISEFLKKATDKQIELIDSILNSNGVSGGINDFRSTLEDLETHFSTLSRRTTQTILGYSKLIDGIDFQGIEERIGWEASRLSAHKKRNIMTRFVSSSGYRDKQLELNGITTTGGNASVRDELSSRVLRSIASETNPELADLKEKFLEQLESLSDSADFSKQKEIFNALNVRTEADFQDMLTNAERLNICVKMSEKLAPTFKRMQMMREKQAKQEIEAIRSAGIWDIENGMFTKSAVNGIWQKIDIDKYIKDSFARVGMTDKNRSDIKDIATGYANVKRSEKANMLAQYGLEKEFGGGASLSNIMEELSKGNGVGGKSYDETLKGVLKVMKAVQPSSDSLKESASDVADAWDKETDAVKKVIKQLPILGGLTDDQIAKHAAWIAGLSLIAKNIQEVGATVADFVTKQADLSAGLTRASQMVDTFSGKANNFDGLRKNLNLTREQAVALGDAINQVALKGVHSVDTVAGIAQNLKSALGKVDTTLLKEAVNLINDLPKEQVDVLITGTGTFDDKANLIANLMNDGNLEKSINLMMNGAFGDMEGSIQLDEKDKAVIAAQEEGNRLLDEIKQGLYSFVPKGFAAVSAKYAKMIGQLAKGVVTVWTLYGISKNVASIAMKMTGKDAGGGGLIGAVKDAWTSAHTPTGSVSWRSFGSNLLNSKNQSLVNLGSTIGAYVGTKIISVIADQMEKSADRKDKKALAEYKENAIHNKAVYGSSVGRSGMDNSNVAEALRTAATVATVGASVAGTIAAIGVALAPATAGITALGGAAIAAATAITTGLVAGTMAYVAKIKEVNKDGNAFSHQEEKSWFGLGPLSYMGLNLSRVFGSNYSREEDSDAKQRKEEYAKAFDKLDEIYQKKNGVDPKQMKQGNFMLKELISLNKHAKAIEMITKGRFTAFDEGGHKADMALIQQMSTVGGIDQNFSNAMKRAFSANSRSYSTNVKLMGERKSKIMNDTTMGDEAKANALNKLLDEEAKMHQKFISNMMNVIRAFGEMPTIMVHTLKSEMDSAFNGFLAKGFVGGVGMATMDASSNMKNSVQDIMTLIGENGKNNMSINETVSLLRKNLANYDEEMSALQKETGISSGDEAEAEIGRIQDKYRDVMGGIVDALPAMDAVSKWEAKASSTLKAAGSDKDKIDESAVMQMDDQLPEMIEQLERLKQMALDNNDKSYAAAITAQINKMEGVRKSLKGEAPEKSLKERLDVYAKMHEVAVHGKKYQDEAEEKIGDDDLERLRQARKYQMLERAKSSAGDPEVIAAKMRAEQAKQFISKMQDIVNRFTTNIDNVLKNGSVEFSNAIRGALEKSEEFDMFGDGKAVLDTISAGVKNVTEQFNAVKSAKEVAEENLSLGPTVDENGNTVESKLSQEFDSMIDEYFKGLDESAQTEWGNKTEQEINDNVVRIYEELCAQRDKEAEKEDNKSLGEAMRNSGFNFESWGDSEIKKWGLGNSVEEAQKLTNQEIGAKIRERENRLTTEMAKKKGISEDEARQRVRADMADDFADNSRWVNEGETERQYLQMMETHDKLLASRKKRTPAKTIEQIKEEQIKKNEENREKMRKYLRDSGVGKEYLGLLKKQTMLRQQVQNSGGHDQEAIRELASVEEQMKQVENTDEFKSLDDDVKTGIKALASGFAGINQANQKIVEAETNAKQEFMKMYKQIAASLDKMVMQGQNLVLLAKQENLEQQQSFQSEYGDVGTAIGMSDDIVKNAQALKKGQLSKMDESTAAAKTELEKMLEPIKSSDPEKYAKMRAAGLENIEKERWKTLERIYKQMADSIIKAHQPAMEALERQSEGLGIEKDLYETIGAPFEYILDIEQQLVRNAREKAEEESKILADMEASGESGAAYEKQKLKVQKASAEVIKASFGAQRDALDKLLGKMMGGFEQIGGIFGPDSDFMKARKAGQGYTQLPSGMISASGGTVTDYANRVAGLQGASGMQNGVKMGRGEAVVFGNGRGIPGMANGGLFGDWIARQWKQLKEGMNNTVGNISGDTGYAVTPNGNKVRMNRKEAIFNYDTLTALARPLGETPEQYVADALSGNPYSGIRANIGYTNVGYDRIFGRGKNRLRKSDDTTNETPEQAMIRQLNEKRASALVLGMEYLDNSAIDKELADDEGNINYQYRNGNLIKKGEDRFMAAKDAIGKLIASKTVKGNAESKMNDALQNSAFGGMAENTGSAGVASSSADKLLLAILEDTHKIVEALGGEADWKKYEELANSINKKEQKQQKSVKNEGEKDDKTDDELKKENKEIYGKRGKQNKLNAEQTARVSANNDKIAGHAYDAIDGSSRIGAGEEKSPVEQALDTDKEILYYVKLIYGVLRQGGGFGGDSAVKSSTMPSKVAETIIPKNDGNVESAPKFHAPSSVSATAVVAGINAAAKAIPKLVNVIYNIPKAVPKATAFFKGLVQKTSTLAKGATPVLSSSKAGSLAKATTAGKASNWSLNLSKWGSGLKEDYLLGKAGELYGSTEKGVSSASRLANKVGSWSLNLSKWGSGVKGSTSPIANGTKQVFARGLTRAPRRALIRTLGRGGATRTLNAVGKGTRFVGKGVRLAGKAAPYADLALAAYGAYKGWNAAATNEGVEEQMLNNSKNFGGEYLYAAGDDFKNGNYMKGIGHTALGLGRGVLASMDFLEHGKNIGMAGKLAYDTVTESYGQADRMKELSSQLSSLHASQAEKQGIRKDDYDAEVKRLMESEEGKQLRKYHEAQQKKDTGWLSDFTGNLLSLGGHNRAGKANVDDTVRMWAEGQAKKNLSAQQQPSEQNAKDAETAVARQSEKVWQLVDHINEEAVRDVAEQDVKSGTVDSYEDRIAGLAETMIDELTSGAIEQYNTPVKEMNAPVEPAQTYVQQGRGAYSGKSDTVAEKARDALSRIEAGVSGTSKAGGYSEQGSAPADNSMQGQGQDARGMQSGRINVEVHITMDTKLFNAEVVKVARENIQSILNKPGTATV